jgi:hypothetical protein
MRINEIPNNCQIIHRQIFTVLCPAKHDNDQLKLTTWVFFNKRRRPPSTVFFQSRAGEETGGALRRREAMRLACLRRGKKRRGLWDGAEEGGPAMKLAREKHTCWSNLGSIENRA